MWILVAAVAGAHEAWAHGGQFLPPPPPVGMPPTLVPPTPPALTPGGPAPRPTTPGTVPPPVTTPTLPTSSAPGLRRGRTAPTDPNASWETWWTLDRLVWLPDRREAFARNPTTPTEGGDPDAWARRRAEIAEREVVPILRSLVDPAHRVRDDVRGSALIALARVGRAPEDLDRVLAWLEDERAPDLVRESAAIAVGLRRRSDPSCQLDGTRLDTARERLFAVFDDGHAPRRTRAFSALSLGLLADQPYGDSYTKEGRLVGRGLWLRLAGQDSDTELTVALLTALGMQPVGSVPDGVQEELTSLVFGRRALHRRWSAVERGHAAAARLRLGGPGTEALVERFLMARRLPKEIAQATFVSFARVAPRLPASSRVEVARALAVAIDGAHDPLTRGLGYLACGHLLGAEAAEGADDVLQATDIDHDLELQAKGGARPSRGFAILGLALACHGANPRTRAATAFLAASRALLADLLPRESDPEIQGALAAAAGLAGADDARPALRALLGDRHGTPSVRGHAAVALASLGDGGPDTVRLLHLAAAERNHPELGAEAALALALLGGRAALTPLLQELSSAKTEIATAAVVLALGRLGDPGAVGPLGERAADDSLSEAQRALAVVALGLVVEPEPRPSLLHLTFGGFYVGRTDALHEAYGIL